MTREEWLSGLRKRGWSDSDISKAKFAWNSCERQVREECAAICKSVSEGVHSPYKRGAQICEEIIRETIK